MTEPAQRPDAHAVQPVTAPGENHESRTDALEGPRLAQLEANLAAVRRRIDAAVAAAGRQAAPPRLIVVTKFHPAQDVRRLASLGVTDVGENRDQEAADKAAQLQDLGLSWHFIGQLQSKKAKSVVKYAASVHSVDREAVASAPRQGDGRRKLTAPGARPWTVSSRSAWPRTRAQGRTAAARPPARSPRWPNSWPVPPG